METKKCSVEGCDRKYYAKGYCKMHYSRVRRGILDMRLGPLPSILNGRLFQKGGKISEEHKKRISKFQKGKKLSEETKRKISESHGRGENHPKWKGGRIIMEGYVYIYKPEHLNGIKDDNRPQNLYMMSKRDHGRINEPYKKRIRELESENRMLKQSDLFTSTVEEGNYTW